MIKSSLFSGPILFSQLTKQYWTSMVQAEITKSIINKAYKEVQNDDAIDRIYFSKNTARRYITKRGELIWKSELYIYLDEKIIRTLKLTVEESL